MRGGHSGRFQHHRRSKAEQRPGRKKHQQVDGSRRSDDRGLCKTGIVQAGEVVKSGVDYNATMESYLTNFKVMLGSEEAAATKLSEISQNGGIHALLAG